MDGDAGYVGRLIEVVEELNDICEIGLQQSPWSI
jgi:hypothetical protein